MTHRPDRRGTLHLGLAAVAWSLGLPTARSQDAGGSAPLFDSARIVVGFPPGGAPDIVARRLAEQLVGRLGRSVIVDNRPGAGGRIAADVARQSPPDGSTLLLNPAGLLTINPHSYRQLNYEPFKDFTPVSLAAQIDFGFAVGPGVPAEVKTLADFAAWAKANPGKASFGSPAAGAPPHFVGDAMSRALGLGLTHVPYRGSGAALNDLMGGQVSSVVLALSDLIQQAKAGKLRLLAASGPARSKFAPEVPTFAEQGVPGLDVRDWFGVYIAGTAPPDALARVVPVVRAALGSDAYRQALLGGSLEAAVSSPQELDRLGRADLERWRPIVKASGFVADV